MAQRLKHLPPMQETWVRSLGWEDPLEKKWQPTSAFLPGESRGQRSLVGYSLQGHKKMDMTKHLHFKKITAHFFDTSLLVLVFGTCFLCLF